MINVTKTYLPDFDKYVSVLKRAWDKAWITNNGELVQELEAKLKEYLGVKNLLFTSNGTVVLQMALKALNITKEVITTPFSYVATTNAILWEGCTPVFVDIEPYTYCIDVDKIEEAITNRTQAILATHVYGYPCDVEKIESIALKYKLKVIYDGAHAFGSYYKGKQVLSYGDISTCSFHATKLFHTVEGGCILANDDELFHHLYLLRQFGHVNENHFVAGINGKASEFHAAMGLCVLPEIGKIIAERKHISEEYSSMLDASIIDFPKPGADIDYNYAYYPIVLQSEEQLLKVVNELNLQGIFPRRYFYPSLNTLPYLSVTNECPVSESISRRILSLPLYYGLEENDIKKICMTINSSLRC